MKKGIALVCMLFVGVISFGQSLKIDWAGKFEYNKEDGYLSEIVGENKTTLFYKFSDYKINPLNANGGKLNQKAQIIAIDKVTGTKKKSLKLQGYKENSEDIKNLEYYKACVLGNNIHVFWRTKREAFQKNSDLYLQTYDTLFTPKSSLKKIVTVNSASLVEYQPYIHILKNIKSENIRLIVELGLTKKSVVCESYILNNKSEISKPLKFEFSLNSEDPINTYPILDFNFLRNEFIVGTGLGKTIVINNLNTNKYFFNTKIEDKEINSIRYYEDQKGVHFIGSFYINNTKEIKNKKIGLIKFNFDESTMKVNNYEFILFSQDQISKIFYELPENDEAYILGNKTLVEQKKVHKNTANFEIVEIIPFNNQILLTTTKSISFFKYEQFTTTQGVNMVPTTTNHRFDMIPIIINENEIKILDTYKRYDYSHLIADPKDVISFVDNSYLYSIVGENNKYGKNGIRLHYALTNLNTGKIETKYFQISNPNNRGDLTKFFEYYPLGFKSEIDNSIYIITKGETDLMGRDDKSPKHILKISK